MSAVTFTTNVVGTPDEQDRRAFRLIVDNENARRAALTPPGTPLPASTAAERKSSYEIVLAQTVLSAHKSYIDQASDLVATVELKKRFLIATDAQQAAALAALPPLP